MSININSALADNLEIREFSEQVCKLCIIDKQHRILSRISYTKVIKINKLIHINLADDNNIFKIIKKKTFVVTMIDDYIDYIIVYLLKRKFDLIKAFRNYLNMMKIKDTLI